MMTQGIALRTHFVSSLGRVLNLCFQEGLFIGSTCLSVLQLHGSIISFFLFFSKTYIYYTDFWESCQEVFYIFVKKLKEDSVGASSLSTPPSYRQIKDCRLIFVSQLCWLWLRKALRYQSLLQLGQRVRLFARLVRLSWSLLVERYRHLLVKV